MGSGIGITQPVDNDDAAITFPTSRYRWWICALLFLGTTICYLDRQVIGLLKSTLERDLHFSELQFADIVFWFQAAYAAGYLFAGRLNDILGVRRGYGWAVLVWSIAAIAHAFARSVTSFSMARIGLGLAEGGNFPAAVRAVSEWFPRRERALATGIFNAGSNVGVMVSALLVPWVTLRFGWETAFGITGILGLLWLLPWILCYQGPAEHRGVSQSELALIQSDPPDREVPMPWLSLLRYRSTWAFVIATLLTSPVWWFYLFWVPDFLAKQQHFDLKSVGLPLILVYLIADFGSVAGGWLSSTLLEHGWTVNRARKMAMLVCALCVVPVVFASTVSNPWVATVLIGMAAAAHQGWSANLYTLASDTHPRHAVSSVVGMGGMAGAIGGMFMAKFVGHILDLTHSYVLLFAIAPTAYILAFIIVQILVPKIEPRISEPGKR